MSILAKTIEVIKSLGLIGVTKSLFNIPLLLYSTMLKPEPAILKFIIMKANNPGNKKSIYLWGRAFTSSSCKSNRGSMFLIFLSTDKSEVSIARWITLTCLVCEAST